MTAFSHKLVLIVAATASLAGNATLESKSSSTLPSLNKTNLQMVAAASVVSPDYAAAGGSQSIIDPQQLAPQAVALPAQERLQLRVVSRAAFCNSITGSFVQYAQANRYDQIQSALLVSAGVAALVGEVRNGRAQQYVSTNALAALANVPPRAPQDSLIPLGALLGPALGVKSDATLAMSAGELRFLPFAQRGMDVIVLARNVDDLSEERVMKVAAVARELGVRISAVWVGGNQDSSKGGAADSDAKILAWLAAATGGSFADLSSAGVAGNPCADRL